MRSLLLTATLWREGITVLSDKSKRKKVDKSKLFVRIFCIFLALLMLLGVLYTVFTAIALGSYAYSTPQYVKIGLYYGTSTTRPSQASYKITSSSGFYCGTIDSSYTFQTNKSITDTTIVVCTSSASGNISIKNESGTLLYDSNSKVYIKPIKTSNYLGISNSYSYGGIFEFTRESSTLQLVNIVELEEYVTGVIPNEIGSSYPTTSIEAFAIAVRSYTLTTLGKHSSYGFDLCWTSCCQVYRGRYNVTSKIEEAVNNTTGQVMTYNNKIVQAYYSASQGGCSCSCYNVWGSSFAYLQSVATPWENYEGTTHGTWTIEYTPSELLSQLRSKGYTTLTSNISKVEITKFADNSTYAYNVKVTDSSGNSITLPRADKIKSALGLYSSNFVCGKAGDKVSRIYYALASSQGGEASVNIVTSSGNKTASSSSFSVINSQEKVDGYTSSAYNVITAYGIQSFLKVNSQYSTELDRMLYETKIPVTEIITLQGTSGNFVFEGKGWGHGVGISQIGMRDLGKLGATSKQILQAYLPDISIVQYTSVK